jgi:hypothetical protein
MTLTKDSDKLCTFYKTYCMKNRAMGDLPIYGSTEWSINISFQHFNISFLALFSACLLLATCFAYSSNLKMEGVYSFVTSVNFNWTTWRYISEYITLNSNSLQSEFAYEFWCTVCLSFLTPKSPWTVIVLCE